MGAAHFLGISRNKMLMTPTGALQSRIQTKKHCNEQDTL